MKPLPGEPLLDVACGIGIVAREAAPLVGKTGSQMTDDGRDALVEAIRRDIAGTLDTYCEGEADTFPLAANIATARR